MSERDDEEEPADVDVTDTALTDTARTDTDVTDTALTDTDVTDTDALLSRLQVIADQPLASRADALGQVHDELRSRLESGDTLARSDG